MSVLNKAVRAQTGECEQCVIINVESLTIMFYASAFIPPTPPFAQTFNVTFHRCSIRYETQAEAGMREEWVEKNLAEENLRDRLMPRWYFSVSGQGLLQ